MQSTISNSEYLSPKVTSLQNEKQAETEKLPPTHATLQNHILRVHCQEMVWANVTIPKPVLPSPLNYGWTWDGTAYTAVTSDLPPPPSAGVELVKCGCTSSSMCGTLFCSCMYTTSSCSCMSAKSSCSCMCTT